MKNSLFLLVCVLFWACGSTGGGEAAAPANLEGFTIENFNNGLQKATKKNPAGQLLEEGELVNGLKSGAWITYYPEDGRIKTITNFINGKKNGVFLELNDRGSVNLQCHYVNDILHDKWAKYRFGSRAEKEVNYNMGEYDGFYREYYNNGKLLKEVEYKNGVQDGMFRQYSEDEQLIMEYEYKNGEKVSGGIVPTK